MAPKTIWCQHSDRSTTFDNPWYPLSAFLEEHFPPWPLNKSWPSLIPHWRHVDANVTVVSNPPLEEKQGNFRISPTFTIYVFCRKSLLGAVETHKKKTRTQGNEDLPHRTSRWSRQQENALVRKKSSIVAWHRRFETERDASSRRATFKIL